ncbi:sodium:solute symporter [Flavihumibacter petaseus]|uniref:Putative SSS family transporter n=1 Tax=Flavihumibacter petaseus NBRC 106054 TaxID=1220578 RepID=A0A0E9MUR7_9BACT|nr:sodium:solute symporter [Flavihumibacter petaseus]GAO41324.1 putative SSS family transporter [Flavihumibacter petaseus NBRC 106054]
MSASLLFGFVLAYFVILLIVAWFTSRNANNDSFFIGNRNSNWILVAFGMIGTSLSGVTFVSVPGTVAANAFTYMQVVLGYFLGYLVIAFVLLPLYYRLNLTSIYNYLQHRFGTVAYKTGALFFIISRTVGATARLYLVINVMQIFILDALHVPFIVTAIVILLMILLYTFEGGVKTIVYTDTLQTSCMLLGLVICVFYIMQQLGFHFTGAMDAISTKGFTRIFNTDVNSKGFFLKQIIGGAFITIAMTGLDQEMMQKNISVKTLGDSQKNIISFSVVLVFVNFLFLLLGGLLYLFAEQHQLPVKGDDLFPTVALNHVPPAIGIIFIIALISALFPSADGALTALTSSFCIDILGIKRDPLLTDQRQKQIRRTVHLTFTVVFLLCIMIFKWLDNKSIINIILDLAGYTYGPLLGLFAFGILTKRNFPDNGWVTLICLVSPVICYLLSKYLAASPEGFQIGIELLVINGLLTFLGLLMISKKTAAKQTN